MAKTEEYKLIVEFLGGKYLGTERMDGHDYDMWDLPASFPMLTQQPDEFGMKRTGYLGFDTSWDWLMPVVQKIGDISIDYYQENNLPAYEECGKVLSTHIVVSIETVWSKIVQFIKWFNSQKQTPWAKLLY